MRLGDFQRRAQSYAAYLSNNNNSSNDPNAPDGAEYSISPDDLGAGPNVGEYPAAYIGSLNEDQKQLYIEKITFLNNTQKMIFDFAGELSVKGFQISDGGEAGLKENSYKVTKDGQLLDEFRTREIPKEFIDLADPSSFYPSLALLCMLVDMVDAVDGLTIRGGFGLGRGANLSSGAADTTGKGSSLSDHAFGRGFDIFFIEDGQTRYSFSDGKGKMDEYYNGLHLLLTRIASLPKFLQPDSIVFAATMANKYTEDDDKIRGMYPGLGPHIDFGFDKNGIHDNHVHLSFGWTRAGHPDKLKPGSNIFGAINTSDVTFTSSGQITESDKQRYLQFIYSKDKNFTKNNQTLTRPKLNNR